MKLPPLSTLRSFEAAARHLSFSKAAEELHVTHGAVSRAIQTLEDALQLQLFERRVRAVSLTAEGLEYQRTVSEVLQRLSTATIQLLDRNATGILTVSTLESLASMWLLPRLMHFHQHYKEIDVRLSATARLADFIHDGVDIALRFGRGHYPGLTTELLFHEVLTPICSPHLLSQGPGLKSLEDLRHYTLIHDEFPIDWQAWLRAAGIADIDTSRGLRLSRSDMAIKAAVDGHGVILGRSVLVADELKSGRLVQPFSVTMPTDYGYYIVYPPANLARPKVKAFRDWLRAEAGLPALS